MPAVNYGSKMEEKQPAELLANGAYTWMEGRADKRERHSG